MKISPATAFAAPLIAALSLFACSDDPSSAGSRRSNVGADGGTTVSDAGADASSPNPDPVVTNNPHEPAGFKQRLRQPFDTKATKECANYYPTGNGQIVSDPTATVSPSNVLKNTKAANQTTGGTEIYCSFEHTPEVYYAFNWRSSDPFGGYDNGANKMLFFTSQGGVPAWGMHYRGATPGKRVLAIFLQQGTDANSAYNCQVPGWQGACAVEAGGTFFPNVDTSPVLEGKWHFVEVYLKRSTTHASQNGIVRMWVDNKLRLEATNANSLNLDWEAFDINHTWDGQCGMRNPSVGPTTLPNDCRPYDDSHYFDDVYVSAP